MAIILRYVYDFKINKRCIKLVLVSYLIEKSLNDVALTVLSDLKLPLKDLIGKGFYCAANKLE